jgi:hypothetical protein
MTFSNAPLNKIRALILPIDQNQMKAGPGRCTSYKNEAANHLYNPLFCDNAALLEKGDERKQDFDAVVGID